MLMRTQHRRAPSGLSAKVPPGSKSGAGCACEVRQEPGRSIASVENSGRAADDRVQVHARRARVHGSEQERNDSNRRVKGTKRDGTDDWRSELAIVPTKPGNQLNGTRWREGRAGTRNCWRAR
jgi:hypothetical protein